MTEKERLRAVLNERSNVRFAYLFGSRVKGCATTASDWDLAVYLESPQEPDAWPVFALEAELSREIGATVQVVDLNQSLTPLLGFEIVRDGEEIVNKDENKRIEVTARLLRQYLDWTHFRNRHRGS